MKDIRLVTASVTIVLSMIGFITLVISGNLTEAKDLLTLMGLPALTFIIGLGSNLKDG